MIKKVSTYFFAAALLLVLFSLFTEHHGKQDEKKAVEQAQGKLLQLEKQMQQSLETILKFQSDEEFHEYFIHEGFQKLGFSFFFFENGKLTKWSDNEAEFHASFSSPTPLVHLANGWYEPFEKTSGTRKVVGLLLIKREFAYENKFLLNRFNPEFGLPENALLTTQETNSYSFKSFSGSKLFSVSFTEDSPESKTFSLQGWLELIAFVFFLCAVFFFFLHRKEMSFIQLLLAAIFLLAIRALMISFHIPDEFYSTDFFSPKYYGSSFFFNSIGDLLLNTLVFFCIALIFYDHAVRKDKIIEPSNHPTIRLVFILVLFILLMRGVHSLIAGLIINSTISYDVKSIFDLNVYSIVAVLVMLILLWSLFFFINSVVRLSGVSLKIPRTINSTFGFYLVLLFAAYSSFVIWKYNSQKELDAQKLFAQRLDTRQDPLTEFLFDDVSKKISSDTVIRKIFIQKKNIDASANKRLQEIYFAGYWSKFDVKAFCFNAEGLPSDSSSAVLSSFRQQADSQGKSTYNDKLFFLPNESGRLSYLALLPVAEQDDSTEKIGTIVLTLNSKIIQSAEGFPELFISSRLKENPAEKNYSFARYSNNALIYAYGNFPYSFTPASFGKVKEDFTTVQIEGYEHLLFRVSPEAFLVVSKPAESFFETFSLFSYVLFFFGLFFFVSYFFVRLLQKQIGYPFNLKQRIRFSILALVVFSFVLIAAGTVVYITHKYDSDQDKNILARLNSLWFGLSDNLDAQSNLSTTRSDEWIGNLNQLSGNYNLDFNLYDENGKLFFSSEPKIFEQGIVSARMNPEALFEMNKNGRTQYVHPENIGLLNFVAAYSPITNSNGSITGYLQLPYFEKQNELNKEISGFLSALINIYLLLLALSVVIALFISSRITQPLLLMQEKLSNIRLGKRNETLEWKRNDEIGELVREYNRMVDELAVSAEKLARSERESAWREMAKQVAHEIKNPLTPMKLSMQHLQRAWNEKSDNMDELFSRISKTLIEQIDALSNIASEFSNFAQMPKAKSEPLDLRNILSSVINLFSGTPNIKINFENIHTERKVVADREQLIRLFSNLIKNSIQAIPENREGKIEVRIKTENNFHIVSISDNGTGIAQEQHEKIFTPSFTTKTSGMGMGLALVKNIAEQAGGRVWFETKQEEGSTFFVELPSQPTAN